MYAVPMITERAKGGKMATKATNANARTYRPEELANALGISGKIVRSYLRQTFTRPIEAKGTTWVLNADQAKQTLAHFKSRQPNANESK